MLKLFSITPFTFHRAPFGQAGPTRSTTKDGWPRDPPVAPTSHGGGKARAILTKQHPWPFLQNYVPIGFLATDAANPAESFLKRGNTQKGGESSYAPLLSTCIRQTALQCQGRTQFGLVARNKYRRRNRLKECSESFQNRTLNVWRELEANLML